MVIFFNTTVVIQAALDNIKRELGDIPHSIQRKIRSDRIAYEVYMWIDGKHVEFNIFGGGKIRNKYEEVELEPIPDVVRSSISMNLKDFKIKQVKKVTANGTVSYEIKAERGKKSILLRVPCSHFMYQSL